MTVWFTSDQHYGHKNICKYSGRPYSSMEEHDEALVANYVSCVKPGDSVYMLGDFCLSKPEHAFKIIKQLPGQKFWVFGNHDKYLRKDNSFVGNFVWAKDYAEIKHDNQKIILLHYAMRVWNQSHRGSWQLYGHSHNSLPDNPNARQLDVGVDCWNYFPVSYEQIKERMDQKEYKPVDHHGRGDEEGEE